MKNNAQHALKWKGLVQLIRVGNSIKDKLNVLSTFMQ